MAFTASNGVTLYWHAAGRHELPAIVFSNSLGTDFRIWDRVTGLLEGKFRMAVYDKRGHGLSDGLPGDSTINDHANDLLAVADFAGFKSFAVVGVSVGGLIAQQVAARAPGRVSALVLCDTAAKIGTRETWTARIEAIERGGIAAIAGSIMERWFSKAFRAAHKAEFAGYRNMLVRQPQAGYLALCAALRDADLTADAAKIRVPTLAVAGEEDGSTPPALVKATADLIPGSRFAIIGNCGHLPCIEQPERLAQLIDQHLWGTAHG